MFLDWSSITTNRDNFVSIEVKRTMKKWKDHRMAYRKKSLIDYLFSPTLWVGFLLLMIIVYFTFIAPVFGGF